MLALYELRCRYIDSRGGDSVFEKEVSSIVTDLLPRPLTEDELDHINSEYFRLLMSASLT